MKRRTVIVFWLRRVDPECPEHRPWHDDISLLPSTVIAAARILAEEDAVARFDVRHHHFAAVQSLGACGGEDFAFVRLLLGGMRDHDAVARRFFFRQYA